MEQWDIVDYHGTHVMLLKNLENTPEPVWEVYPVYHLKAETQIVKESELKPVAAEYRIPVSWQCCGIIDVEATSMAEAIRIFDRDADEYSLPTDSNYVDASFMRETYGSPEETQKIYALYMLPRHACKDV